MAAAVGELIGHKTCINGNVMLTLVDGDGNIKSIQRTNNVINAPYIMSAFISGWLNSQPQTGTCARYLYLFSWGGGTVSPSTSFSLPFSTYATVALSTVNASNNVSTVLSASAQAGGAVTAGIASFFVTGTFCFSGCNTANCSIGGIALMWDPDYAGAGIAESWFAQATFAQLGITENDKLSIQWAFCMSTSTAGA